jgi:hypothetical protein
MMDSPDAAATPEPKIELQAMRRRIETPLGVIESVAFLSRGFTALGCPEFMLGVRLYEGDTLERYAEDAAGLMRSIAAAVQNGVPFDVGGWSAFDLTTDSLLGHGDVGGLLYTWVPGDLPSRAEPVAVMIVPITRAEMTVARAYGPARVLAMLGHQARYFPTPEWFDPKRPELDVTGMNDRVLPRMRKVPVPRSSVYVTDAVAPAAATPGAETQGAWRGGVLTLRVARPDAQRVQEAMQSLAPREPFALLTSVPPDLSRGLVWDRARWAAGTASVISHSAHRDDPRVAGNFLACVSGPNPTSHRVLEDGYAMLLSESDEERVVQALATGSALVLDDARGERLFEVVYTD